MPDQQHLDAVLLEIVWSRLTSIVTEQGKSIIRTSFSPLVREAGDISTAVYDETGRMIAHGLTGTAGHIVPMNWTLRHFLKDIPASELVEGDALISNDPWKGSGHLFDFTVATPIFLEGTLIGFVASTAHVMDVGGIGPGPRGGDIFEEGLFIPTMRMFKAGKADEGLLGIISANVREPNSVLGDLLALAGANQVAAASVVRLVKEYDFRNLHAVAEDIFTRSERASRLAVSRMANGNYSVRSRLDGIDEPIDIALTLKVSDDTVELDYTGSSAASRKGINVCLGYASGYSIFGLWCALRQDIPLNFGSLKPFKVTAVEGSILNARFPSPVSARHIVGQMLPGIVLQAAGQVLPQQVISESAGALWSLSVRGYSQDGRPFLRPIFLSGGMGARAHADGPTTTQFPTGTSNIPIEIAEATMPIIFKRKEIRIDSGGAGKYRGGLSQVVEVEVSPRPEDEVCILTLTGDRAANPAAGLMGAGSGARGSLQLAGQEKMNSAKLFLPLQEPLDIRIETPGGGGYGRAEERDLSDVLRDVAFGYVSPSAAFDQYGVVFAGDGKIDIEATTERRAALCRARGVVAEEGRSI